MSTLEDLADRVERLLLRHSELKRTNGLLEQQLAALGHERDSLQAATECRARPDRRPARSAADEIHRAEPAGDADDIAAAAQEDGKP